MNTPKVSILIPVYNREKFIKECIESALAQTYRNIEIVIVDNASTDTTWDVINNYTQKDIRIKAFRNNKNIGPVKNWLACLEKATGLYTKILWSDDLIHPLYLEQLVPYLDDSEIGFVFSSVKVFETNPKETNSEIYQQNSTGIYNTNKYIEGALLNIGDFPVSPGCALFRTVDVKKNLLLDIPNKVNSNFPMHAIGNDLLLFLLTAKEYQNFAIVCEPLSYFRSHNGSITTSAPNGKIHLHYDLAKGYFSDIYDLNKNIQKKLNTMFLSHTIKYDSKQWGIYSINDFHPLKKSIGFSYLYIFERIFKRIFTK